RDLAIALLRIPRGDGKGGNASIIRALALDCDITLNVMDPLDCDMATAYTGPRHKFLHAAGGQNWRSNGDTVERLEALAVMAVQWPKTPKHFTHTAPVLETLHADVLPKIRACGPDEGAGLLTALAGKFVAPAPSGAPTRGRLDVLPTGRNFYSVDSRAVPTPTAWKLGWKSANLLIEKHLQDHGDWPRTMLLTAWGTANMRTGGDDIAQCLALMGVKPKWDAANRRVTGFEIIPHTALGRPRVDVTLRISGFFRDAFPQLISLVDSAARAVMALDEPDDINPAAKRARTEGEAGQYRVYGSKPGAYGAGLQAMIDERLWADKSDLAEAYLDWGSYAYGKDSEGDKHRAGFETRLSQTEAIVQNQDNREHDLLDSDDYYQFEGGAAAAVSTLQGTDRPIYHNDHSRPERPVIRTLEDEIGRVVRSRVVNPKWIDGVKRHGYKGAFEIAATVDYMFAFAATTGAVKSHHFDLVHAAFLEDDDTRDFIADNNAPALREIAQRLSEAIDRGLWTPKSNSAGALIESLI
ncbi:MAG: cobaltochelatase subunit CobN, partial [Paracoccaceae bacterium]